MLRLFPEKIQIGLGSSYAALAVLRGKRMVSFEYCEFQPDDASNPPWHQGLASINIWLARLNQHNAEISVYLSSELAVLHAIDWRDELQEPAQQRLIATNYWHKVYGPAVEGWDVQVTATGYQQPWLASAVDKPLLQALDDMADQANCRLVSVEPLTFSLFNQLKKKCKTASYWFVVSEPDRVNALYIQNRQCCLFKTLPAEMLSQDAIESVLQREMHLAGLADSNPSIYLVDGGLRQGVLTAAGASSAIQLLETGSRLDKAHQLPAQAYLLGAV